MRDTQKPLRHAVYNLLNGAITYDGNTIPVFDEKKKATSNANLFILLSTQQETDDNTSDAFITDSSIDIEINHTTEFEVSKDAIDDVANQILSLILPTPTTDGLTAPEGFQFTLVRRTSSISRNYDMGFSDTLIAKIITVSVKIVQQF